MESNWSLKTVYRTIRINFEIIFETERFEIKICAFIQDEILNRTTEY